MPVDDLRVRPFLSANLYQYEMEEGKTTRKTFSAGPLPPASAFLTFSSRDVRVHVI